MKYPYHRLLLFFVSRRVNVNEALERYGLPPVGGIWLANAKTRIRDNAPRSLSRYIDSDAPLLARAGILDWAKDEGFHDLWLLQREFDGFAGTPELDRAFRVFSNSYSRALMGMLLLSSASDKEISKVIEDRLEIVFDDEALEIYRRLFWDIEEMGRTAWDQFILKLETKEERHYITLGLPGPNADEVRAILGMKIVVDHVDIVDHIASTAHLLFKLAIEQPLPEEAGAIKWAELAIKAINVKKQLTPKGPSEEELLLKGDGFKGLFSVQPTRSSHPTLADLQGYKPEPVNAKIEVDE